MRIRHSTSDPMIQGRISCGQVMSLMNDPLPTPLQHLTSSSSPSPGPQINALGRQTVASISPHSSRPLLCNLPCWPPSQHSLLPDNHGHPLGFKALYFTHVSDESTVARDAQAFDMSLRLPRAFGVMFYIGLGSFGTDD